MSSDFDLDPDLETLLANAIEIARAAGDMIRERHAEFVAGGATGERQKGHEHNLVTAVDLESERLIVGRIEALYPDHGIRSEEGAIPLPSGGPGKPTWVIDPLDGTNNFAHGYPVFAVNIAIMAGDQILVGVTYDPLRDELFCAGEGRGATLNGRTIRVSGRSTLGESIIATGFPYDKATNPDNNVPQFNAVVPHVRGIRRSGSAALDLAYVAAGRLDAYWEHGTAAWDVAAGILLVREAGGTVTDYDSGEPTVDHGRFVASNGRVHSALLEALRGAAHSTLLEGQPGDQQGSSAPI